MHLSTYIHIHIAIITKEVMKNSGGRGGGGDRGQEYRRNSAYIGSLQMFK